MELAEALDEALRDRYPIRQPKRPATHRQGLTARMNGLERELEQKGDRKGTAGRRAAEAAGISPRTWRKWRAGTQPPSPRLLRKLETAFNRLVTVPAFRKSLTSEPAPNRVKITAEIRWSKSPKAYYNKKKYRTTTLESMRAVMVRVIRSWAMAGPEAAADTLERGAASVYRSDEIRFEGDSVIVEFPEGDH